MTNPRCRIVSYWDDKIPATKYPFVAVHRGIDYRVELVPQAGGRPFLGIHFDLGLGGGGVMTGGRAQVLKVVEGLNLLFAVGKLTHRVCHLTFHELLEHMRPFLPMHARNPKQPGWICKPEEVDAFLRPTECAYGIGATDDDILNFCLQWGKEHGTIAEWLLESFQDFMQGQTVGIEHGRRVYYGPDVERWWTHARPKAMKRWIQG